MIEASETFYKRWQSFMESQGLTLESGESSSSTVGGGIKSITFDKLIQSKPEMVIESAVRGMLPKGPLGRAMFRKLKVYAGASHDHAAQKPQVLDI